MGVGMSEIQFLLNSRCSEADGMWLDFLCSGDMKRPVRTFLLADLSRYQTPSTERDRVKVLLSRVR
jgi:hypothetical protein